MTDALSRGSGVSEPKVRKRLPEIVEFFCSIIPKAPQPNINQKFPKFHATQSPLYPPSRSNPPHKRFIDFPSTNKPTKIQKYFTNFHQSTK
jgi:hypothetical protein